MKALTVVHDPIVVPAEPLRGIKLIGSRYEHGTEVHTVTGVVRELGPSRVYLKHAQRVRDAKDAMFAQEVARAADSRG